MISLPPTFREADFHKSSYSDPDRDCVQVARRGAWVALRDSKMAFNGTEDRWLVLPADQFDAVLAQCRR